MTEASGGNAAQWFERAYAEDPGDTQIALGYGKSLIAQGQVGAAIFVLEPLAKSEGATPETRETYVKALLSANRLTDAEPLIWQLYSAESVTPAGGCGSDRTVRRCAAGCGSGGVWHASWNNPSAIAETGGPLSR